MLEEYQKNLKDKDSGSQKVWNYLLKNIQELMEKYERTLEKMKQNFENEKNNLINSYEKKIAELNEDVIKRLQKALEDAYLKNQQGVKKNLYLFFIFIFR